MTSENKIILSLFICPILNIEVLKNFKSIPILAKNLKLAMVYI